MMRKTFVRHIEQKTSINLSDDLNGYKKIKEIGKGGFAEVF